MYLELVGAAVDPVAVEDVVDGFDVAGLAVRREAIRVAELEAVAELAVDVAEDLAWHLDGHERRLRRDDALHLGGEGDGAAGRCR